MDKLRRDFPAAAAKLEVIPKHLYAAAYVLHHRWGMDTSNIVEVCNNILKDSRSKNVLDLLVDIWDRVMIKRFERWCSATAAYNAGAEYTSYANELLDKSKEHAGGLQVLPSTGQRGKVRTTTGWLYDVWINVQDRLTYCSCFRPQILGVPCGHVIAFFRHQNLSLQGYISWDYRITNWGAQHQAVIPVVRADQLQPDPEHPCDPPFTRMPRGRPRKRRYQTGTRRRQAPLMPSGMEMNPEVQELAAQQRARRVIHCGICGEEEHNRRRCRRPHN